MIPVLGVDTVDVNGTLSATPGAGVVAALAGEGLERTGSNSGGGGGGSALGTLEPRTYLL